MFPHLVGNFVSPVDVISDSSAINYYYLLAFVDSRLGLRTLLIALIEFNGYLGYSTDPIGYPSWSCYYSSDLRPATPLS